MTDAVSFTEPLPLAPTLADLGDDPRAALQRIAREGFRFVQLNAAQSGLRPRELDRSARRGLLAKLRQLELGVSGVDLWIPPAHFLEAARVDRAVSAVMSAVEFAAELDHVPLSLSLPEKNLPDEVLESIAHAAQRHGIALADHALPGSNFADIGIGIDPAQVLSRGGDPAKAVADAGSRLVSARLCDLLSTGMRGPIGGHGPGAGRLDVLSYRVALEVAGYRRPVVLDARQWAEPWAGAIQSKSAWTAPIS